jgi:hypothetical protein
MTKFKELCVTSLFWFYSCFERLKFDLLRLFRDSDFACLRRSGFAQAGASNFLKKCFHHFLNGVHSDQVDALGSLHLLLILPGHQTSLKSQP